MSLRAYFIQGMRMRGYRMGWIKLHRKITEKGFYYEPDYLAVWIHLLLNANHFDNEFLFSGNTIELKAGQLIISQRSIAESFIGIPLSKVNKIIKYFEKEKQIELKTEQRSSLITIINWNQYQGTETILEQNSNDTRTILETK